MSPPPGGVQFLLDGEELEVGRVRTTKSERGVRSAPEKAGISQSARSMIGNSVTGNGCVRRWVSNTGPGYNHATCVCVSPSNMY